MRRAAVFGALAIGALHATAVVGLLAAATPAWRPATGERSPFGVFLIPMPAVASDREPSSAFDASPSPPCTRTYEIDEHGNLYDPGPPSRAFLRSLPAGSDGHFPEIGMLCRAMPVWSKQAPGQRVDEPVWMMPDMVAI